MSWSRSRKPPEADMKGAGLSVCLRVLRPLAAAAMSMRAGGCSTLGYYAQAAHGQYALWADARPVGDWLKDPATDPKLRARLEKAQEIRDFAVTQLGLPDNGS